MADVTALDVAKKKMDNAAGSIEQMKGAFETLQIRALRPTLPLIKKLADEAGTMIEQLTPAITQGVQDAVDTGKAYLKTHYTDNPDFQKLDMQGKVDFVINDMMDAFNKWYAEKGSVQVQSATDQLVSGLISSVEFATPRIVEVTTVLGSKIGLGILKGASDGLKDSFIGRAILNGSVLGTTLKIVDMVTGDSEAPVQGPPSPPKLDGSTGEGYRTSPSTVISQSCTEASVF
jgi:hypothetical protein